MWKTTSTAEQTAPCPNALPTTSVVISASSADDTSESSHSILRAASSDTALVAASTYAHAHDKPSLRPVRRRKQLTAASVGVVNYPGSSAHAPRPSTAPLLESTSQVLFRAKLTLSPQIVVYSTLPEVEDIEDDSSTRPQPSSSRSYNSCDILPPSSSVDTSDMTSHGCNLAMAPMEIQSLTGPCLEDSSTSQCMNVTSTETLPSTNECAHNMESPSSPTTSSVVPLATLSDDVSTCDGDNDPGLSTSLAAVSESSTSLLAETLPSTSECAHVESPSSPTTSSVVPLTTLSDVVSTCDRDRDPGLSTSLAAMSESSTSFQISSESSSSTIVPETSFQDDPSSTNENVECRLTDAEKMKMGVFEDINTIKDHIVWLKEKHQERLNRRMVIQRLLETVRAEVQNLKAYTRPDAGDSWFKSMQDPWSVSQLLQKQEDVRDKLTNIRREVVLMRKQRILIEEVQEDAKKHIMAIERKRESRIKMAVDVDKMATGSGTPGDFQDEARETQ